MKALIVIPARLKATRLPDKPLAMIGDAPMIVQVWRRAMAAQAGPVLVAAAEAPVAEAVRKAGGEVVMTDPDLPSGSDRIHVAAQAFDPQGIYEVIVNVQGDLPTLDPGTITATVTALADPSGDIATPVAPITTDDEKTNPNVVKAVVDFRDGARVAPALSFSRSWSPDARGAHYHHIGIYAYRRPALARFVSLPPGVMEQRERLEQLRAMENGMRILAVRVDTIPLGVDTPADLEKARRILGVV